MTFLEETEILLFKHKLNDKNLLDLLPRLSEKTIRCLIADLVSKEKDLVYVFTDGGCKNNGKQNAVGAYAVYFPEMTELNKVGEISHPTNQKAELTGILKMFEILCKNTTLFTNKRVIVCSDSMYSIKCINEWSKQWQRNGWKTSKGESVQNSELIKNILHLKKQCEEAGIEIGFKHVFSHTTPPADKNSKEYQLWYGNYCADKMVNDYLN